MKPVRSLIVLWLTLAAPIPQAHGKKLKDLKFSFRSGLLTHIIAKELCSCMFVSHQPRQTCLDHSNLPIPELIVKHHLVITDDPLQMEVTVTNNTSTITRKDPNAKAVFRKDKPLQGCHLVE